MTFLPADDLTWMRAEIATTLPGTATFWSLETASDNAGGQTAGTVYTWGTCACRVDHLNRRTQVEIVGGAEGFVSEFHLIVPHDAPTATFRNVDVAGITYQIRELDDSGSWLLLQKCRIVQVE